LSRAGGTTTLATLLASFASGEAMVAARRARQTAIAYLLAAAAALCGVGFLIGAGYIWTARRYGALEASLGFGIGFLVLASLILVIYKLAVNRRREREIRQRNKEMANLAIAAGLSAVPALLTSKAALGAALAAVAYAIYRENKATKPEVSDEEGGEG
jgi:EamA domain-containing membrane protein RarD